MNYPESLSTSRQQLAAEGALCKRVASQLIADLVELQRGNRLTDGAIVLARRLARIAGDLASEAMRILGERQVADIEYLRALEGDFQETEISPLIRSHNSVRHKLSRVRKALVQISQHVRYISSSTRDSVAEELFLQVRTLLDRLTPGAHLVLRKQHSFGLKFLDLLAALSTDTMLPQEFRPIVESAPSERVLIFSYPRVYQRDYLHLSLLSHEVGHHLWNSTPLQESPTPFADLGLSGWLSGNPSDSPKYAAWRRWAEEASADIYAALMTGPAYLFALDSFFESTNIIMDLVDGLDETLERSLSRGIAYPTRRLRTLAVLRTLEAIGVPHQLSLRSNGGRDCRFHSLFRAGLKEYERIERQIEPRRAFQPLRQGMSIRSFRGELKGDAEATAWKLNELFEAHLDPLIAHCRAVITKAGRYPQHEFSLDYLSVKHEAEVVHRLRKGHPFGEFVDDSSGEPTTRPVPHQLLLTYGWCAFLRDARLVTNMARDESLSAAELDAGLARLNRVGPLLEQTIVSSAMQVNFRNPPWTTMPEFTDAERSARPAS